MELQLLFKKLDLKPMDVDGRSILRNIVERSPMTNNDEVVVYSWDVPSEPPFGSRVVLSRPHFQCEGDIYRYPGLWNNPPKITRILDSVFRLKNQLDDVSQLVEHPSKALAWVIASNYYDCMSGGMPLVFGQIVAELCRDPRVNQSEPVYPKSEGKWHTIGDFLKDWGQPEESLLGLDAT